MIKKLVRYGNSNALVIDRAILELLNIGEGSMVKISTDGKSLIITPESTGSVMPLTANDVAEQAGMTIADGMQKAMAPFLNNADQTKMQAMMDMYSSPEAMKEKMKAYKGIMRKYAADNAKLMSSEEYMETIEKLTEKYKDNLACPEYIEAVSELTYRIAPNLKTMQAEIDELNKNTPLALPEQK